LVAVTSRAATCACCTLTLPPMRSNLSTACLATVLLVVSLAAPAAAQPIPGGGGWTAGQGAAGDNTYEGFVDQPLDGAMLPAGAAFHVSGWVVDTAAEGWAGIDDLQVWSGAAMVAHGSVALSRPDVATSTGNPYWAASGFDALVPATALPGGPAVLTVAAHTPGKGTWTKTVHVTVAGAAGPLTAVATTGLILKVITPANGDDVVDKHDSVLNGVGYDTRTRAELGTGVDRVQAYIDGPRGVPGSVFLGEANWSGVTWSLIWNPAAYDRVRHHILYVYGRSNVTGEERLVTLEINIVAN